MYYITIYHGIAKTKDYNGTISSPSMALPPAPPPLVYKAIGLMSAFLQSTTSPWSLTISWPYLFWQKQHKWRFEREQQCKISRNGDNSSKHPWLARSRVDPGSKDHILGGVL
jgi:hypothetical protein